MLNPMQVSDQGMDMIKAFESCRLTAYQDQNHIWTIGWGHTGPEVCQGLVWTQAQADSTFSSDLQIFVTSVNNFVSVNLQQCQYDALVDFCYNEGPGRLKSSTLLRLVNQNDFIDAANEFPKWDIVAGKQNAGLLRRRHAEQAMFNNQDWTVFNYGRA